MDPRPGSRTGVANGSASRPIVASGFGRPSGRWRPRIRLFVLVLATALTRAGIHDEASGQAREPAPGVPPAGIVVSGEVVLAAGDDRSMTRAELVRVLDPYQEGRRRLAFEPRPVVDRAAADEQGIFRVQAPAAGPWLLRLSAPGHAPLAWQPPPFVADTDLERIGLRQADALSLRVLDAAGRALPHANVRLVLGDAPTSVPWPHFLDDSLLERRGEGRVVIWLDRMATPGATADIRALEIAAPGHRSVRIPASPGRRTVRLSTAPQAAERALRALGPAGLPLPDVLVVDRDGVPLALTGEDGTATILLSPDETVRLLASNGWRAEWTATDAPRGDAILREPTLLLGTVSDDREMPLAHAWVTAQALSPHLLRGGSLFATVAVTDATGRYSLHIPAEAELHVTAVATGHLPAWVRSDPNDIERTASLVLTRAAAVAGSVVDVGGARLPGAVVTAIPGGPPGLMTSRMPIRALARTRADGRFSFHALGPNALYSFAVNVAGFAPSKIEARAPAASDSLDLRIVLGTGSTAAGRVVDEAGNPVARASVSLDPVPGDGDRRAMERNSASEARPVTTDASGVFTLRHLAAGRYDVQAHAVGFAVSFTPAVPIEGSAIDLGEIVLSRGLELVGRVEAEEGEPVSGATVSWRTDRASLPPGSARLERRPYQIFDDGREEEGVSTDPDGRFTIPDLADGQTLDLHVHGAGYARKVLPGLVIPREEELIVSLQRAGDVTGRVVDRQGAPVQAEVQLDRGEQDRHSFLLPSGVRGFHVSGSGEDGTFTFRDVAPGTWRLEASARGYRTARSDAVEVIGGEESSLPDLVLDREETGTLIGRVLDSSGVGVEAWVFQTERGKGPGGSGERSDAAGAYAVRDVPVGPRDVSARRDEGQWILEAVEIAPGENRLDLVLEGAVLEGRVVDDSGVPIDGALVWLHSSGLGARPMSRFARIQSGADGTFRFVDLQAGPHELSAEKAGWAQRERRVVEITGSGVQAVEVVMTPGGLVRGRLLGLGESDLREVTVTAFGRRGVHAVIAADATYEIQGVGPGDWMVSGKLPSRGREVRRVVRVPEGGETIEVDLDFEEIGWSLRGRVLTAEGQPHAFAVVTLRGSVPPPRQASTDFAGRFVFDGVPEGRYEIRVSATMTGSGPTPPVPIHLDADREIVLRTP